MLAMSLCHKLITHCKKNKANDTLNRDDVGCQDFTFIITVYHLFLLYNKKFNKVIS